MFISEQSRSLMESSFPELSNLSDEESKAILPIVYGFLVNVLNTQDDNQTTHNINETDENETKDLPERNIWQLAVDTFLDLILNHQSMEIRLILFRLLMLSVKFSMNIDWNIMYQIIFSLLPRISEDPNSNQKAKINDILQRCCANALYKDLEPLKNIKQYVKNYTSISNEKLKSYSDTVEESHAFKSKKYEEFEKEAEAEKKNPDWPRDAWMILPPSIQRDYGLLEGIAISGQAKVLKLITAKDPYNITAIKIFNPQQPKKEHRARAFRETKALYM